MNDRTYAGICLSHRYEEEDYAADDDGIGTPEQIAEKYNITENAFFIRMTRIKKKISDYIKDNEVSL